MSGLYWYILGTTCVTTAGTRTLHYTWHAAQVPLRTESEAGFSSPLLIKIPKRPVDSGMRVTALSRPLADRLPWCSWSLCPYLWSNSVITARLCLDQDTGELQRPRSCPTSTSLGLGVLSYLCGGFCCTPEFVQVLPEAWESPRHQIRSKSLW